jgi:hypothetical protein
MSKLLKLPSKRVEAAVCLGFASRKSCRSVSKRAREAVEVRVEAMSRQPNFDTRARSYLFN